jgi:hypothetical protein
MAIVSGTSGEKMSVDAVTHASSRRDVTTLFKRAQLPKSPFFSLQRAL